MAENNLPALITLEGADTMVRFTNIFKAVNRVDENRAAEMFKVEVYNYKRLLEEKGIDASVTELSIKGVFLDAISNGLSLSEHAKQIYIQVRNVKSGRKDGQGKDIYENRLVLSTSPTGKVYLAQKWGAIDRMTDPVFVYEGDEFEKYTAETGMLVIKHKAKFPRDPKAKLLGGYVFTVYRDGKREPFFMDMQDVARLAVYSSNARARWNNETKRREPGKPNDLYFSNGGQIDTGFFGAKLVSHALKYVRKQRTQMLNEVEDDTMLEDDLSALRGEQSALTEETTYSEYTEAVTQPLDIPTAVTEQPTKKQHAEPVPHTQEMIHAKNEAEQKAKNEQQAPKAAAAPPPVQKPAAAPVMPPQAPKPTAAAPPPMPKPAPTNINPEMPF